MKARTTVGMVTLGCSKNTVDSENMLGMLAQAGYGLEQDETRADVIIVNTCSFIGDATTESIRTILELGNTGKKLIVSGCLAQREQQELLEAMPEVSAIIGTGDFGGIVGIVERVQAGERFNAVTPAPQSEQVVQAELPRLLTSFGPSACLKIAEGCDHSCTFCIIPQFRGKYVSRPEEHILREARRLAQGGVREIVLIAEDTTRYGQKETGKFMLARLLEKLSKVDGIEWIRILYAYPNYMTDDLLETMRDLPKVVKYFDVPLQHTHPDMLRAMKRPRHEPPDELIARMRAIVPEVAIRTTFITGFPGETEEHFEHVLDFVRTQRLAHVGAFAFSPEKGTPAATMKPVVPKRVREKRRNAVMKEQQQISLELHQGLVGQTLPFLVESIDVATGRALGRTYRDAPEIDGTTYVESPEPLEPGEVVPVRITRAEPYDLFGVAM